MGIAQAGLEHKVTARVRLQSGRSRQFRASAATLLSARLCRRAALRTPDFEPSVPLRLVERTVWRFGTASALRCSAFGGRSARGRAWRFQESLASFGPLPSDLRSAALVAASPVLGQAALRLRCRLALPCGRAVSAHGPLALEAAPAAFVGPGPALGAGRHRRSEARR